MERLLVLMPYIIALHMRGLFEGRLNAEVLLDDDEVTMMKDLIKVTECVAHSHMSLT